MDLKGYQVRTLEQVKLYLEGVAKERQSGNTKHASMDAWEAVGLRNYKERKNGLGEDLPNFCLKIPTGGGKTLLAVRAIDLINSVCRKKQTGLVLWVVPTTQIYRQTIQALRDRDHPYRQALDVASGGRTVILEKTDKFTPLDVEENLVLMMLMLPSAARQTKETLKVFKDNGGFQSFFPAEDDVPAQSALLDEFPNLDHYGDTEGFWQRQVKTSLGNTLRILSPVIILDEGHKAYSQTAQDTLRGFNPSIIVELSATPSPESNKLVEILGIELNREEMIKLDLHIVNKASPDWKDTLLDAVNQRAVLEEIAKEHQARTGVYIRPICLIQAERTGKEQRTGKYIHSEDVRERLTKHHGIPEEQVAVKTSEKDELKEVDDVGGLLSPDCPIKYIITKQALQEGWDCPFAYVLAILTNPSSKTALTQLVGRILRQPYARKTGLPPLDESYVFCFQKRGGELLDDVRDGFKHEGLGDLAGRIVAEDEAEQKKEGYDDYPVRERFRKVALKIVLPVFVAKTPTGWRPLSYEMDILSAIEWGTAKLTPLFSLPLSTEEEKDTEQIATLSDDTRELVKQKAVRRTRAGGLKLDPEFIARQLLDVVPNPWRAYGLARTVLDKLLQKHKRELVTDNLVYIIGETRKHLLNERHRLAKAIFDERLSEDTLRFLIIGDHLEQLGFRFPAKVKVSKASKRLTKKDGQQLQKGLFEAVPEDEFNDLERGVAWFLDDQQHLYFWFRNIPRQDYYVQGWKPHKIYPDFILTTSDATGEKARDAFVIETKGIHLKNEDTSYKQTVFEVCNGEAKALDLEIIGLDTLKYSVVHQEEWERKLREMLVP